MNTEPEKIVGTSLTTVAEYAETAMVMADLRSRHAGVIYDVAAPKQMKLAKEARAEIRGYRTGLEKTRKEIKAPALERCRQIDEEAKRLTGELVALEEPIDIQIKAEEARAETERLAKLEAERLRVLALMEKIDAIRNVPAGLIGKPSVIIAGQLAKLEATELDEEALAEHYITAQDALTASIARVKDMLAAQEAADVEAKRVAAEREELAKMRAENERLQREAEERAAADLAERERLAGIERDRIAAEEKAKRDAEIFAEAQARAEKEAAESAERARLAAIERAEREAHEANVRKEMAEIRAKQEAERERQAAEQRKLDEQAAQLKRDQQAAAAKAEAERLANLGLREAAQAVVDWFSSEGYRFEGADQVMNDLAAALANDDDSNARAVTVNRTARAKKVAA